MGLVGRLSSMYQNLKGGRGDMSGSKRKHGNN